MSNQVTENLKEFKIPVGTLLLMAENAIAHNIIFQKHPLHALIKSDENFLYVINNNFLLLYLNTGNNRGFLTKNKIK